MAPIDSLTPSTLENVTLSSPLKLGDIELRNRNVMSALTRNRSVPTNVPKDANVEYYTQRAAGGAGLIVSEGVLVSPQGSSWPNAPGIWSKDQTAAWKKVTDSVHATGGKIFAQLWHLGRIAHNDMPEQKNSGKLVRGPSAIAARGGQGQYGRYGLSAEEGHSIPIPLEDPRTVIEEFKVAGANAKEAGFDGVEIHSANGYLVNQFLDQTANHRTDEWGGSIENRARFGLEVADALIEIWGPGRVGVKISPTGGYNDVGMPLEDALTTFTYYIEQLISRDVAYIALVRYKEMTDPEIDGKKRGTPHDVLESYGHLFNRSEAPGQTKLLLNGGVSPQEANELINSRKIDAAVFGWLWIGNPDLQIRVEKEAELVFMPDVTQLFHSKSDSPRGGYSDYPKGTY